MYGRLCRRLTIAQVAEALEITPANVDNYFRHVKARLTKKVENLLRRQIQHYCHREGAEQEFTVEWHRLGEYLVEHGGLEEAVRRAYDLLDPVAVKRQRDRSGAGATLPGADYADGAFVVRLAGVVLRLGLELDARGAPFGHALRAGRGVDAAE